MWTIQHFFQTKPWVVRLSRSFACFPYRIIILFTQNDRFFPLSNGFRIGRFSLPNLGLSSSRQWTKLNRLWWCPTLGDLRTFTLKSWDFNGFQWISMDFIVLECWKFPRYFLAILMGNNFFAVIFFGLRFCAGHQQIVSERLRMWQSHYNQSLFWVWFSYPAI